MIVSRLVAAAALAALVALSVAAQDARSLVNDAMTAYQEKAYAKSAALFKDAIAKGATNPNTFYNAACSTALAGDADGAFALLDQAIARGYRDAAHMAVDTDLDPLHADERWSPALAKAKAAEEAYLKTINAELAKITSEDQADRSTDVEKIDWEKVSKRDAERRARVKQMIEAGQLKAADDYFNAALVLQHGDTPDDYDLANKLASRAAELDPTNVSARWLAAAAKDRYLMSVGKPQIYGTQFRKVGDKWSIDPIDETAVTDAERQKQGVPTLAETRKRLDAMNAKKPGS
jgi:tetratricopeptide (TPR) repeat protein